jgi:hypothetical protein
VFERSNGEPPLVLTQLFSISSAPIRAACALPAAVLCCLLLAAAAPAADYVVDTASDAATPNACSGAAADCTLRGAIDRVNADAAPGAITFVPAVTTITISSPLPVIANALTIDGAGTTKIVGSGSYDCTGTARALVATVPVQLLALPIHGVCGRAVASSVAAPTIRIGPRRADGSVAINGDAAGAGVEIFRADPPAVAGEGLSLFTTAGSPMPVVAGRYSFVPPALPGPSERFTAITTGPAGSSTFSTLAQRPLDLTSPTLIRAVAIANNSVRLDFDEPIGGDVVGAPGAFSLTMAGYNRQITSVGVYGSSVVLGSATTPWGTGEAGTIAFTGNGRVTDLAGNELLELPASSVLAGPGEITGPAISSFRTSPAKFCRRVTSRCYKRKQGYIYLRLNKPSRVTFNVTRANGGRFVVRFVRKLDAGSTRVRLLPTINGRTLPATSLIVEAVAEDAARNLSAPVRAPFRVVTSNKRL